MAIYEFKCQCGNTFEEIISIVDRNNTVKCKCGKKANRNISTPTLIGFDKNGSSSKG
jgi:putative FmdB family regulatory protein